MPYLQPFLSDEEEQRLSSSAPGSATTGGGSSAGPAPAATPSSGQFQAINAYFSPESAKSLASNVSGKIGDQATQAGADVTKQASDYKTAGNKAVDDWTKNQGDAWNQWSQNRETAAREAVPTNDLATFNTWTPYVPDPVRHQGDEAPRGQATQDRNVQLQGAVIDANRAYGNAWDAYQPFQGTAAPTAPTWTPDTSGAKQVGQEINALGSESGRAGLLSQLYGAGGTYTPGMARLDAMLLGTASPEQQLSQQYGTLASDQAATSAPIVKAANWQEPTATRKDPYDYPALRDALSTRNPSRAVARRSAR